MLQVAWLAKILQLKLRNGSEHTAVSRKVVGKKAQMYTRQDRKVVWVHTRILHIGLEKCTSLYHNITSKFV